jgi:hypothetical protein
MKLLSPVMESATYMTCINGLMIIHMLVWKQIFSVVSLDFLQNGLPEQLEDAFLATQIVMYFQHDGAPSHCTQLVMPHLNNTFPNWWIGHSSTINWPSRSPDLTPSDFCLWGWMKGKVYGRKVDT